MRRRFITYAVMAVPLAFVAAFLLSRIIVAIIRSNAVDFFGSLIVVFIPTLSAMFFGLMVYFDPYRSHGDRSRGFEVRPPDEFDS